MESAGHDTQTGTCSSETHHEGYGNMVAIVKCPGENTNAGCLDDAAKAEGEEGLSGVEVAHDHREVYADTDTWGVEEKLDPGITGSVAFNKNEIDIHKVENRSHS